jgi:hypothetical protein
MDDDLDIERRGVFKKERNALIRDAWVAEDNPEYEPPVRGLRNGVVIVMILSVVVAFAIAGLGHAIVVDVMHMMH